MSAYTPTPWCLSSESETHIKPDYSMIGCESSMLIASVCGHPNSGFFPTHEVAKANAEFIVRACNAHDDLVAALSDMRARFNALRTAVYESRTLSARQDIQHRFNRLLDREGVAADTQTALDAIDAALAKAGVA